MGILIHRNREKSRLRVPTFSLQHPKMTTPRRPLRELSTNIILFKDLSLYKRGKIIGKAEESKKPAHITKRLKVPDRRWLATPLNSTYYVTKVSRKHVPVGQTSIPDRFKSNLILFVQKNLRASHAKIRKHFKLKFRIKSSTAFSTP